MSQQALRDARPILPTSEESLWDRAALERDRILSDIQQILASEGVEGWIRRSKPGEYPMHVAVELWQPREEQELVKTFDRAFLIVRIKVDPFRVHPFTYEIILKHFNKELKAAHWRLSNEELHEITIHLVKGGKKPAFFAPRTPLILRLLTTIIPLPIDEKNELVEEAKSGLITWTGAVKLLGLLMIFGFGFAWIGDESDLYSEQDRRLFWFLLTVGGLILLLVGIRAEAKRPVYQAVVKQPMRSPRREFRVDSWQVSVPDAGEDFHTFKQRILTALRNMGGSGLKFSDEVHESLTPRGFEARDRLVITKDQCNVHVHIYPFGRDAFVGWESYLNWARWSETEPVSLVVRGGKLYEYRSVDVGGHVPSQFDLMEMNALAETAHRNIVREIKSFLKERELEADLDFRIIRGDRSQALNEGKEDKKA